MHTDPYSPPNRASCALRCEMISISPSILIDWRAIANMYLNNYNINLRILWEESYPPTKNILWPVQLVSHEKYLPYKKCRRRSMAQPHRRLIHIIVVNYFH